MNRSLLTLLIKNSIKALIDREHSMFLLHLLQQTAESALNFIFPPLCLHCNECLENSRVIFCAECLKSLIPINPQERCPYCFSADFQPLVEKCCEACRHDPPMLHRVGAVFDYEGPPATLIKQLKYGNQSDLAKGAGAYLAAQFISLQWPFPDYIVPMPMSMLRRIERGYNQSLLLAQVLGDLLNRPVCDILSRKAGDFSQAGLNHRQRKALSSEKFSLKTNEIPCDATLLLIDDVMTTGSSLRCCAEALLELLPKQIYGLTLCRTI